MYLTTHDSAGLLYKFSFLSFIYIHEFKNLPHQPMPHLIGFRTSYFDHRHSFTNNDIHSMIYTMKSTEPTEPE